MKRLADYVRDSPLFEQWQVIAFTNAGACMQYVKQGYRIDLLAAQPELLNELKGRDEAFAAIPTAALVMKLGESKEVLELHQYQPLPLLLQRLSDLHAMSIGHPGQIDAASELAAGIKIISVYSATGGTGKTALALHLAHAASTHRYRTFYLNLERWNTSEAWLGLPQNGDAPNAPGVREGLSEFLYGLKAQPDQSVKWLLEHRNRHSLLKGDYLAPCTNMEDRLTLGAEDALGLVDVIARSRQYDLIVIDLDDGLEELHAALFEQSNQVLWVMNDDGSVRDKQSMKLRYGEQRWGERFRSCSRKFVFVNNRATTAAKPSLSERNDIVCAPVQLPEVPEWRGAAAVTLLSSPLFRAAADKLFKFILQEGGE